MVFEVRRRPALFEQFSERLEQYMAEYHLTEAEREAWRKQDIRRLSELGVHPYFLPQITRLLRGNQRNDSRSDAARLYRRSMVDGNPEK